MLSINGITSDGISTRRVSDGVRRGRLLGCCCCWLAFLSLRRCSTLTRSYTAPFLLNLILGFAWPLCDMTLVNLCGGGEVSMVRVMGHVMGSPGIAISRARAWMVWMGIEMARVNVPMYRLRWASSWLRGSLAQGPTIHIPTGCLALVLGDCTVGAAFRSTSVAGKGKVPVGNLYMNVAFASISFLVSG